jgi:hypothetical protein
VSETTEENAGGVAVVPQTHPGFAPKAQIQAAIEARKEIAHAMRAWRATQWGKDLEEGTLKALGAWAKRHGLDITEVEVLGGKPYVNASFYLRKLAEAGPDLLEYARADHVHFDQRLVDQMNEPIPDDVDEETKALILGARRTARQEHYRRTAQRVAYNLPDKALAAVVYRVKLKGMEGEFVGADWCGNKGTRTIKKRDGGSFTKDKDPVGDEEPAKTAETRAARRCLRQAVSVFPETQAAIESVESEAKQLAPVIEADREANKPQPLVMSHVSHPPIDATIVDDITDGEAEEIVTDPRLAGGKDPFSDGPRTKAQIYRLEQVMKGPEWSDEERAAAADYAISATSGEMEEKIRWAKQENEARRKAAA